MASRAQKSQGPTCSKTYGLSLMFNQQLGVKGIETRISGMDSRAREPRPAVPHKVWPAAPARSLDSRKNNKGGSWVPTAAGTLLAHCHRHLKALRGHAAAQMPLTCSAPHRWGSSCGPRWGSPHRSRTAARRPRHTAAARRASSAPQSWAAAAQPGRSAVQVRLPACTRPLCRREPHAYHQPVLLSSQNPTGEPYRHMRLRTPAHVLDQAGRSDHPGHLRYTHRISQNPPHTRAQACPALLAWGRTLSLTRLVASAVATTHDRQPSSVLWSSRRDAPATR